MNPVSSLDTRLLEGFVSPGFTLRREDQPLFVPQTALASLFRWGVVWKPTPAAIRISIQTAGLLDASAPSVGEN